MLFRIAHHRFDEHFEKPMIVAAADIKQAFVFPDPFFFDANKLVGRGAQSAVNISNLVAALQAARRFGPGQAAL